MPGSMVQLKERLMARLMVVLESRTLESLERPDSIRLERRLDRYSCENSP